MHHAAETGDLTGLSDEQRAAMQGTVDAIYGDFSRAVLSNRRVRADAMTGGDYFDRLVEYMTGALKVAPQASEAPSQ